MDTSKTYIKMRIAAIPDLGLGVPILSKLFVVTEDTFVDNKGDFYIHCDRAPYWCQLERQGQLQEMIDWSCWQLNAEFNKFAHLESGQINPTSHFNSMEQLWMALVMLTLYHKKWYNGEWRVENDKDKTNS